jgi:transcriptional regulator with XRE-family HTH domain
MMTPAQCRAARALVNWSQQQLAEAATIGNATIRNFESGNSAPQHSTLDVLRRALEAAGVIFVDENGEGAGVRLKKKPLAVAEITEKIEALDQKIATLKVEGEPSPEIGMNRLKKALVQNERTKLKNRRTKIKNKEPK